MVLQRVAWAVVCVDDEEIARIGPGLLALVGVAAGDGPHQAARLADKTLRLRLFGDDRRGFERSLLDVGGSLLAVSQLTLHADVRRGNRPSWSRAASPEQAEPIVEAYADAVAAAGVEVGRGRFGAMMAVGSMSDGPVTIILDTDELARPRRSA